MNKFFEKDGKTCLYLDNTYSLKISQKYNFCNVELLLRFHGVSFPVFRFSHKMTELELAKFYGDCNEIDEDEWLNGS
jgi:hypothetical protein